MESLIRRFANFSPPYLYPTGTLAESQFVDGGLMLDIHSAVLMRIHPFSITIIRTLQDPPHNMF
jgi:hypothetical protein